MRRARRYLALPLLALPALALAQRPDAATALSKASQNPVGDLTSVPLQFNFYTGGGLRGRTLSITNLQPVLPLPIGKKWNIIWRTIVPFVDAPTVRGRTSGVGDIVQQIFFTKSHPDDPIWGVGPIFSFPTATTIAARTNDWGLGPTAVVLKIKGPWVIGLLASQLWTIASHDGDGHLIINADTIDIDQPDLNQLTIQPFINYNLADGWAISTSPIMVANWELSDVWTVPLGLGVTKVAAIGKQPVSIGLQYYGNVVRPDDSGQSQIRFIASLLFPRTPQK